jgi:hypothetical protein
MNKGLEGSPAQVRWGLGPQVLDLLRRVGATQDLVAVRVASEAGYDVTGSPRLGDPELGHRSQVERRVGRFLLGVEDAALVKGKVLRVAQRSIPKSIPSRASLRTFSSCE